VIISSLEEITINREEGTTYDLHKLCSRRDDRRQRKRLRIMNNAGTG
jgi:hypothetical protein